MGLGDIFKATENKELKDEIERLNGLLTPELLEVKAAMEKLDQIRQDARDAEELRKSYLKDVEKIGDEIKQRQSELIQLDGEILLQSFGIYRPTFDFCNSDEYKEKLESIRQKQKELIKNDMAVAGSNEWSVNGDRRQGQKMVNDMKKLVLRAFNGECDELVSKVKYNNFDSYKKRINASCEAISKLGKIMKVSIMPAYRDLKLKELTLAFEYAQKKQEEKEAQKALREQMREEAKLQKEIEEQRRKLEKEQNHYSNALSKINAQLQSDPQNEDLLAKKRELEAQAAEIEKAIQDVDYREANKRAGYVYVISNIGAFGENIYKIGMTRRLDPMDRVDELGDASVPFNFDVHAMIFTEDAPALESALHRAFEDKKVNMVNQRREFFNVTLDEIKAVIKANYDKTVEFNDIADAEQYRVSERMKHERGVVTPPVIRRSPEHLETHSTIVPKSMPVPTKKEKKEEYPEMCKPAFDVLSEIGVNMDKISYSYASKLHIINYDNTFEIRIPNHKPDHFVVHYKNGQIKLASNIQDLRNQIINCNAI